MKSKTMTVILIISVAFNLIVLGAGIGFWLREPAGPRFPAHLSSVLENVDPEQRQQMKKRFREFREEGRKLHRDMRQQQRSLSKVILAEPFDEQAALAAFAETRKARDVVQAHMHTQMVEVLSGLDRKQRAELLRRILRQTLDRRPPKPKPESE